MVRSTTLLRPLFLRFFLFHAMIVIVGEGIGARSVRFPHRFLCQPDPLEETKDKISGPCAWIPLALPLHHIRSYMVEWDPAVSIHMALSSNPSFSRAGRADTKNGVGTVQILRRYPPPRLRSLREREKIVKKVDGVV